MDNLEEMDKFLDMCNLPRLNWDEIENMIRPISSNGIELLLKKKKHTKKTPNKQKSRTRQLYR